MVKLCITVVSDEFVASDYGRDCDHIGAQYITNVETCKNAAGALQLAWHSDLEDFPLGWEDMPKGCVALGDGYQPYYSNNGVFFNLVETGSRKDSVKSLCEKGKHYFPLQLFIRCIYNFLEKNDLLIHIRSKCHCHYS